MLPYHNNTELAPAAHCRDARNWIGVFPEPAMLAGQLVIDVPPFNQGDNMPALQPGYAGAGSKTGEGFPLGEPH